MASGPAVEITRLLKAWQNGDKAALDRLAPVIYDELRQIAHRHLLKENRGHSLQTTALVNEAYLRLVDAGAVSWHGRAHFFAVSANMMRRILVDWARSRHSEKRGAGALRLTLDESRDGIQSRSRELIRLDDALDALARKDPRKVKVVECRFFGGLSAEETAVALGVSEPTVLRDWKLARAWLVREMAG